MRTCCTEASLKKLNRIDYICITEHSLKRKNTTQMTMDKQTIIFRCNDLAKELLLKYFGDDTSASGTEVPEKLEELYTLDLPRKIAKEFRDSLSGLWDEIAPGKEKSFLHVMDHQSRLGVFCHDYFDQLFDAQQEAKTITPWERLTKTNHEDVTAYKSLLKQYTDVMLAMMIEDFMEDVQQ